LCGELTTPVGLIEKAFFIGDKMRIIRNQTFCWQEKFILRLLRSLYQGQELVKMKCLYSTLTEMDSDFNGREIKWYTKTISTYSGLSKEWIPSGLKKLEELGIIQIVEEREQGRFKGKHVIFTPEKAKNTVKTVIVKPVNGESLNGFSDTSEHISLLEHNSYLEHIDENSTQEDDINHNTDIIVESTSEEQLENEFSIETLKDKVSTLPTNPKEQRKPKFIKPTLEDVQTYIASKKLVQRVDAEQFWHFYESKDWMVGKNKMKNWHSAVATWAKRSDVGKNTFVDPYAEHGEW
jgi:hypothetical protein